MRRDVTGFKLAKYRLLWHLPGQLGLRYDCKLGKQTAHKEFSDALLGVSDLYCIDLGANLGRYTIRMASACARVFAFEPDPWTAERLRANTEHLSNVEITEAAVGLSNDPITLYRRVDFDGVQETPSEGSSVIADKSNLDLTNSVQVQQVDFIAFLHSLDRDVAVLKIDIEGAELDILEALLADPMALAKVRAIFVETHESRVPDHEPRVMALRARVKHMRSPRINLYWN